MPADRIDRTRRCPGLTRRRRTVAVVTPYFTPMIGGVENYTERVAKEVHSTPDLRAVVITSNHEGSATLVEEHDGIPVVRLGTWLKASNTPLNPWWPVAIRRLLNRYDVDLVNVHAPVPYLADVTTMVAGRRPVVMTYHSGSLVKNTGRVDGLLRLYERHVLPRVFARATELVAVSPVSLAARTGRAHRIPPGVDITLFRPATRVPAPADEPIVLYVGRMDRTSAWKGVDVLVDAFAELLTGIPTARLELVGKGDAVQDLHRQAVRLGVEAKVRFSGVLRDSDLVAAYQRASVLVLPSLTESESFGMTLIEAMACGRPVIGSAVGGIPHVVTDGSDGLLVPPGDANALATACRRVLTDPTLADRLGGQGCLTATARYAWSNQLSRTLALFREVLDRQAGEIQERRSAATAERSVE
jgi:glycosyltransferase involved in cell wall biosynthesis